MSKLFLNVHSQFTSMEDISLVTIYYIKLYYMPMILRILHQDSISGLRNVCFGYSG